MGTADQKEQEYFALDSAGNSKATLDWAKQQREKQAVASVEKQAADDHKH